MKAHWTADIFPLNEGDIERIAEDIQANGQQRPITVWKGEILDGRTRFAACKKLGIEPFIEEYVPINGPPTDEEFLVFSWSMNEVRRHLTTSQRACAAAEIIERLPEEAKGKGGKRRGTNADNSIGKTVERFKVHHETVRQARDLLRGAPEEFALVKAGKKTVADAHREFVRVRDATKQLHSEAEDRGRIDLLAAKHPDLAEKVESGAMNWQDAASESARRENETAARMEGLHKLLVGITVSIGTINKIGHDMQESDWNDILAERHGWQRENYLRDIKTCVENLQQITRRIQSL
jgi:ParB-like chromosome segregation protein Spo0J